MFKDYRTGEVNYGGVPAFEYADEFRSLVLKYLKRNSYIWALLNRLEGQAKGYKDTYELIRYILSTTVYVQGSAFVEGTIVGDFNSAIATKEGLDVYNLVFSELIENYWNSFRLISKQGHVKRDIVFIDDNERETTFEELISNIKDELNRDLLTKKLNELSSHFKINDLSPRNLELNSHFSREANGPTIKPISYLEDLINLQEFTAILADVILSEEDQEAVNQNDEEFSLSSYEFFEPIETLEQFDGYSVMTSKDVYVYSVHFTDFEDGEINSEASYNPVFGRSLSDVSLMIDIELKEYLNDFEVDSILNDQGLKEVEIPLSSAVEAQSLSSFALLIDKIESDRKASKNSENQSNPYLQLRFVI